MRREVGVALLVTLVLLNVVEVVMRMMRVRFILWVFTRPVKMRPRMDTLPVKGHFLSM